MALTNLCLIVMDYPYASRRGKILPSSMSEIRDSYIIATLTNVNFSHGDEVNTEFVYNAAQPEDVKEGIRYNYLIEYSGTLSEGTILSAWYVVGIERLTKASLGQYRLLLRRDVVSEYWSGYKDRPFYVRKGWINDGDSPLLFNPEGVAVDQVKTAEYPIKDETLCQWVVGYMAPNFTSQTVSIPQTATASSEAVMTFASTDDFYSYIGASSTATNLLAFNDIALGARFTYQQNESADKINGVGGKTYSGSIRYGVSPAPSGSFSSFNKVFNSTYLNLEDYNKFIETVFASVDFNLDDIRAFIALVRDDAPTNYLTPEGYQNLKALLGKVVYIKDTATNYVVGFTSSTFQKANSLTYSFSSGDASGLFEDISDSLVLTDTTGSMGENSAILNYSADEVDISLTAQASRSMTWTARTADTIPTAEGGPYKIFCAPFMDGYYGSTGLSLSKAETLKIFNAIAMAYGSSLYDIQILPYCPAREVIQHTRISSFPNRIYYYPATSDITDWVIDADSNNVLPIFWTSHDSGTFYRNAGTFYYAVKLPASSGLTYSSDNSLRLVDDDGDPLADYVGGVESKVKDITELWRLSSPNWQGQSFDFSAQKNGGISAFRIDFTYRPYSPFIIVRPVFGNLYGSDFGDDRGLVLGGDYSMPTNSSEWAEYQLRNVNYENIFNRQMQSLELSQRQARIEGLVSGIAGTARGTAQGATKGAAIGGGAGGAAGAVVGGLVGGATALAGGIADMAMAEELRRDQMSASKEYYYYNLQNIQARPYSLARGGYQIAINREFPTLEYYRAPEAEIEAIRNMITYGSMTIGAIETVAEAVCSDGTQSYTWVSGSFQDIGEKGEYSADNETNRALRDEFEAGVYLPCSLVIE